MLGLATYSTQIAAVAAVTIVSFLYYFYQHFIRPLSFFKQLNIPGPKPKLFIGSAFDKDYGGHLGQVRCLKEFGNVYGSLLGPKPVLVVADPDMLRDILVKHFSNFPNRYAVIPPAPGFDRNLLVIQDDDWKRVRTVLIPTFSAAKLKQIDSIMCDACDRLIDNLIKRNQENGKVDLKEACGEYSMDIIMAAAFGVDLTSDTRGQKIQHSATTFFTASGWALIVASIVPSIYPYLGFLVKDRMLAADHIIRVSKAIIAERRRNLKEGSPNRRDLLQLMIEAADNGKITDDEIVSQSFVFVLAGYETTANALSYAAYLLATNPDAQQRLIDEIDEKCPKGTDVTTELVSNLPYLDMVMSESLRMYPPAYIFNRVTKNDIVIKGISIPKGLTIAVPIYGIHHNEKLWPDPEKFIPERFTPEAKAERHPFAYVPFGNGPRNCIGMRLALLEAKLALVKVLQNLVLKVVDDTQIPLQLEAKLTLSAVDGVIIGVKER